MIILSIDSVSETTMSIACWQLLRCQLPADNSVDLLQGTMPDRSSRSCSRAWPMHPPPPPPKPSPFSNRHHRRLLLLLLSHLCLLFHWHHRRQFHRLRLHRLSSFCRRIPLELRWPNGGRMSLWNQVGCHSPKQLPGTTGKKRRRSRGSVLSGASTRGAQS